ncbi:MAG: LuxR C-terminal-related transcriptional regulator [Phormidesmis sp.]
MIVFSANIELPSALRKAAETALSAERNPIARYIAERHAPAHESLALGKKNAEVGAELWITENSVKQALKKIFRKLEASSCTEIAVQLSAEKQPQ